MEALHRDGPPGPLPSPTRSPQHSARPLCSDDPALLVRTFRTLGVHLPVPGSVRLLRRGGGFDLLLRMERPGGDGGYLLALDTTGGNGPDRQGSWGHQLTRLYAIHRLPPVLVALCRDTGTARRAAGPLRIGTPEWAAFTVRRLALGPHNVPLVLDPVAAGRDLPLAAFAAITHSRQPHGGAVLSALAAALKSAADGRYADLVPALAELVATGVADEPRAARIWHGLAPRPRRRPRNG
ncbi:hypothetical protein [Streptomyces sp. NPDC047097]|uniref:hypothetical protein n=1 Tax=Streptomyces sp. NPDC047097 TaxID=3155260 RepID=UPI003411567B